MAEPRPVIAILGPGTVGGALARSLHAARRKVIVGGRDPDKSQQLAGQIDTDAAGMDEAARSAGVSVLTVRDDAIEAVCEALAEVGCWGPGDVVLHCSGALDSSILSAARQAGAGAGSWHPLQTFPAGEMVASLAGVPFFAEGDGPAVARASELTSALGGTFHEIAPHGKALYHAAAVMACNYVSTLLEASEALMSQAGIEPGETRKAMAPLTRRTVENAACSGPVDTLTGPIVRGDAETVRKHLAAMQGAGLEGLAELYRALGERTVELAARRGTDVSVVRDALRKTTDHGTERETDA
jgi:predicted short-subunit dehydrogenase-like oxidoreductase (DUF2520 family)